MHQGAALETAFNRQALPGRICLNPVCQEVISWSTLNHSLAFFIAAERELRNFTISFLIAHILHVGFQPICLPFQNVAIKFVPAEI